MEYVYICYESIAANRYEPMGIAAIFLTHEEAGKWYREVTGADTEKYHDYAVMKQRVGLNKGGASKWILKTWSDEEEIS